MAKKDGGFDLTRDYTATKDLVATCIAAQIPCLIHGKPGIGKSDMIKEIGKELGRPVIDIRLALLESVDIKGYPFLKEDPETGEKALSFAMNEEFPRDPESNAIIFFDEINAAMPTTQLAMYQLILDRAIGTYSLPKGVSMVAAGNREADKGGIFSMPKPLENRFTHIELEPTFDSWVQWAIGSGIHPEVIGYLAKNEQKLNTFDPQTSSRAFATPRSWATASKLHTISTNENAADATVLTRMASAIGHAEAMEFVAFRKVANDLPSVQEIITGKAPKLTKGGIDISYMVITNVLYKIREIHQSEVKAGKAKDMTLSDQTNEYVDNFFKYMLDNEKMFGQEMMVMSVSVAVRTYKLMLNKSKVPTMMKILKKADDLLSLAL